MKPKVLNIVFNINAGLYAFTVLLFLTIYLGFLAELVLGTVNLISALVLLTNRNRIPKTIKRKFIIYFSVVVAYFIGWFIDWSFLDDYTLFIIGVGIMPMLIGAYFINILYQLKKLFSVDGNMTKA